MRRFVCALLAAAFLTSVSADFPSIPPLPESSWPASRDADPFARALLARITPEALAQKLASDPELPPRVLRNIGTALMSSDVSLRERLPNYLSAFVRAAGAKRNDVQYLTAIVVIDPLRFAEDASFRKRVTALLPANVAALSRSQSLIVLDELNRSAGIDFETSEAIASAAHIINRRSASARVAFDRTKLRLPDDLSGPITESFYSLNSAFFTADEAKTFLAAVHRASPDRRLVVLADRAMRDALGNSASLSIVWIDTHARAFTPWPRDPFIVARGSKGDVVFINRPNAQPHREEDQNMVRAIVDATPDARWTTAPAPFHNGQVLLTPAAAFISIHSVEWRAMQILGVDHVPSETFDKPAGVMRYVNAVHRAANELRDFYRMPVRFVHAMPSDGSPALMNRLSGGAGFDLDSIVTILPKKEGRSDALVGDLSLGARFVRDASSNDWRALQSAYHLRADAQSLAAAQSAPENVALQTFLDEVSAELQRSGMTVRRLPLLNVPPSMVAGVELDAPFLITWNNVVLEKRGAKRRAEGFASMMGSGDGYARKVFAESGYDLELFPPLIRSILLGGGYRCASNHLRK